MLASAILCLVLSARAAAVEQVEEFVKGLQERGLNELALEYLEGLKTSPLANEATKQQIPYFRGIALVEQSRKSADSTTRNRLLDRARSEFEEFVRSQPDSIQAAEAQLQLATVELTRGQELMAQSGQLPKEDAYNSQRRGLGRDARERFGEARVLYGGAESAFSKELEKQPPPTSSEARDDTGSRRQELRGRVAQLRFLAAQTQYEIAQTYPREADEFRQINESAAHELAAVYDEFARTMLVGLYARLYEGRCYQAIGNYQLALGCYEELLGKDNVLPPFRKLIAAALHRKVEVLIAQEKLDAAIAAGNACLQDAHKEEGRQPEWLAVRFRLAESLAKKSALLPEGSAERRRIAAEAREAYRFVSRVPGEFQMAARAAVADTAASMVVATGGTDATETSKEEPRNFQAAYELGKDALAAYNAAKLALPSAEKNNPPAVPELQAQMARGKEEARHYFRAATTLVDLDTDPKLVNEVRYFLCWLYWEGEDYFRAAVLGEFLARRYPDHSVASSAAKISMASFERLYNQAVASAISGQDRGDFEARQMARMAEFIVRRWPGTEDADAAFGVLVGFAIRSGKTDEAERMLQQTSTQSRPRLELLLGNALWGRVIELSQPNRERAIGTEKLATLKSSATKYLRSGLEAARKEPELSEAAATSALYLAQSLLGDGNYAEAIALLEDKAAGPLVLVETGHSAAKPQYAIEVYKAALRAYVSVSPPDEKKTLHAMQALEKVVRTTGADGKGEEQLTRIYLGFGVALQKQLEELRAAGKRQDADRVEAAFRKFLDRIGEQPGVMNWPTRSWLAQMYYTMGTGAAASTVAAAATSSTGGMTSKADRDYIAKARDAYEALLKDVAKDPKFAPGGTAVLAVKAQLGDCYRELGEYQKALDAYSDVLKEKEASLIVQRAAALAYQQRGQREDPRWFEFAIHGGYKLKSTGQNRIWGWLRISQVAGRAMQQDEKYRDAFFEARLNISRCRYLAAAKQTGEVRQQDLGKAKQSIQSLAQLYPDLGGANWKPAFDQLLQKIQQEESKLADAPGG